MIDLERQNWRQVEAWEADVLPLNYTRISRRNLYGTKTIGKSAKSVFRAIPLQRAGITA